MANKRVIDMQELSELGDGWYTFLDSATGGTKKFDMGNMLNAIADAQDAAEAAQSAATSAREAADGVVSPTVTPSQITGGTRVTITDVDGTRTFDVMDGPQGEKGDTGDPAAPGSITTDMLADGAVTPDKLAPGITDGHHPSLSAGSATGITGDAETASWMERTTAADGAALIEAVYGNTVVNSGSLLSVRIDGVETVGFNQWDEEWELGTLDSSGQPDTSTSGIRSKNFIPVLPSIAYYIAGLTSGELRPFYYDGAKAFVSRDYWTGGTANNPFTIPSTARYMKFVMASSYGTTYKHDICINLSDPARNGTYEPHWSSQRTIPVSTYFPQGMRSAGTVYDELRADAAVTRVGERAYQSGDESDTSVITDGTVTHYALDTPTTTPIDPPLTLSYRTGAGGTERVMVASGTTSAPPVFATRYPLDPADLAASIAPVDGPTAKTNHQVGDLLMLGFTLCKVTTAIARGEAITIGTNVVTTTVMAEVIALITQ